MCRNTVSLLAYGELGRDLDDVDGALCSLRRRRTELCPDIYSPLWEKMEEAENVLLRYKQWIETGEMLEGAGFEL